MGWYRVIKTIKGHRYVYLQRTWREGTKVRTENRYLGPAAGDGGSATLVVGTPPTPVTTTNRILYHGSRGRIRGTPRPSDGGTFGPGLYLTLPERAQRYATYTAKIAANPDGTGGPRFTGTIYAADVSQLTLKVLTWDEFLDLAEAEGDGAATAAAKAKVQEILVSQGYDGLDIRDDNRPEVVIFSTSICKISLEAVVGT